MSRGDFVVSFIAALIFGAVFIGGPAFVWVKSGDWQLAAVVWSLIALPFFLYGLAAALDTLDHLLRGSKEEPDD